MGDLGPIIDGSGGHLEQEDCWCGPKIMQPCYMCGGSAFGCQHCDPLHLGMMPKYDDDEPVVVIHNDLLRDDQ